MLLLGDTFYIPNPSSRSVPHLWVVLTEPNSEGIAVCANLTSRKTWSDLTVVLKPGDHRKITEESCVYYAKAQRMNLKKFEDLFNSGSTITCKTDEPFSKALLETVQMGLIQSKETPRDIKEFCKNAWKL